MDWKLELIGLPVSDIDRAKAFYVDQVGFVADHDHTVSDEIRFVQVTPPGSACSVAFGRGISNAEPGSVDALAAGGRRRRTRRAPSWSRAASRSPTSRSCLGVRSSTSATPTAMRGRSSRSHRDELKRVKAVVYDRYGPPDVLRVENVAVPAPTDGQVRVKIAATSINLSDWECLRGSPCTRASAGCARRLAARSVRTSRDGSTPSAAVSRAFSPVTRSTATISR